MNFFPNMSNFNEMSPEMNNLMMGSPMMGNDLFYKINELENKIRKLEQRIARLESEKGNNYYSEPDTSMYMI